MVARKKKMVVWQLLLFLNQPNRIVATRLSKLIHYIYACKEHFHSDPFGLVIRLVLS